MTWLFRVIGVGVILGLVSADATASSDDAASAQFSPRMTLAQDDATVRDEPSVPDAIHWGLSRGDELVEDKATQGPRPSEALGSTNSEPDFNATPRSLNTTPHPSASGPSNPSGMLELLTRLRARGTETATTVPAQVGGPPR